MRALSDGSSTLPAMDSSKTPDHVGMSLSPARCVQCRDGTGADVAGCSGYRDSHGAAPYRGRAHARRDA
jgi:hypothetical protein